MGSMGLSGLVTNSIITRLRTLLEASRRQCIVITMGRINENKLANFPEIDVFCLIANDDVAIIPARTFHVPVITPWELEIGLGARDWDSTYRVDLGSIIGEGLSDLEKAVERVILNNPEDPIDDDDCNSDNGSSDSEQQQSSSTSNTASSSNAITVRAGDSLIVSAASIPSVERFLQREYRGLDPNYNENKNNVSIQMGMFGTSLGYRQQTDSGNNKYSSIGSVGNLEDLCKERGDSDEEVET